MAEIIRINVQPCPRNPFAIDYEYFDELNNQERFLETGAMIHFLQRVLLSGHRSYHSHGETHLFVFSVLYDLLNLEGKSILINISVVFFVISEGVLQWSLWYYAQYYFINRPHRVSYFSHSAQCIMGLFR